MYDVLGETSFGEPGMIVFAGIGGVAGVLFREEVEDEAEIALEKVVVDEGADIGSSNEIKWAPSSALSSSSVFEGGMDDEPECNEGWLSDQGDFRGGSDDGAASLALRDGEAGTEVGLGACGVLRWAKATVSSDHCAVLAGG